LNLVKCDVTLDSKQTNLKKSLHLLYDARSEVHAEVLLKIEVIGVDKVATDPAARGGGAVDQDRPSNVQNVKLFVVHSDWIPFF
jgi:hypothetical protein